MEVWVCAKGGWTSRAGFSLEIKFQWCIVHWTGMKHPNLIEPGDKTRDSLALLGLGTRLECMALLLKFKWCCN